MDDEATPPAKAEAPAELYVYLYRDERDRVRYVGYGRSPERASSHLTGASHSEVLNQFLAAREYRIEIAGPFEEVRSGQMVETALISALKPDLNVDPGQSRWRFRPLGVPLEFAERQVAAELRLGDFLYAQGENPSPVLFVIVTDFDFKDRVGYNPASPPSDEQIRVRTDRWWQLQRFLPEWTAIPEVSPGLLVGVFGSPGRQTVIASARIDRAAWAGAELLKCGKLRVPLLTPGDLDAFSLRGRRIAREAGLKFGGIPSEFFIILGTNGVAVGGRHLRNQTHSS